MVWGYLICLAKGKRAAAVNELEEALKLASTDRSARKAFYRLLLDSDLYTLTNDSVNKGTRMAKVGEQISVRNLNDGSIPVFTSEERIFDNGVIKEQVYYRAAKGGSLLSMFTSARVIINPFSDYGKELLPDEIKSMLDGTIFNDITK